MIWPKTAMKLQMNVHIAKVFRAYIKYLRIIHNTFNSQFEMTSPMISPRRTEIHSPPSLSSCSGQDQDDAETTSLDIQFDKENVEVGKKKRDARERPKKMTRSFTGLMTPSKF